MSKTLQSKTSISEVKEEIQQLALNIKYLEENEVKLRECSEKYSSKEWESQLNEVNRLKLEVTKVLEKYNNEQTITTAKKTLSKRQRKRMRILRRRAKLQINRKEAKIHREKLHEYIDEWLENEKQKTIIAKRTKDAADYAKLVLTNVTKKKSDGMRYIELLKCLKELRRLRQVNSAHSSGANDFNSKIDRLEAVWKDALQEYENEEKILKSILMDTHKSTEDQWNEVLFGSVEGLSSSLGLQNDKDDFMKFVEIRRIWDSCIVPQDFEYGSYIPFGWVLPPECPSEKWKGYRK